MTRLSRPLSGLLVSALALALGLQIAPAQGVPSAEGAVRATTFDPATALSTWGSCSDPYLRDHGLQCARLTVPLDYDDPAKGTISLAVSRKRYVDPRWLNGAMITNPGGPGASGLWMPLLAELVPGDAGRYYEWIGFDPRGVGESSPALSCNSRYFGTNRPLYAPYKTQRYWLLKVRDYARACGASASRKLLPYMRSIDNVRDLETLRAALQATAPSGLSDYFGKLNYYGYSYGTYLGELYATMHPDKVGLFILDSVVDPRKVWYAANLDQDRNMDKVLNRFFAWMSHHDSQFHLGHDWRAIRRGYYRERAALDVRPAAGGKLGPDELDDAMIAAAYTVQSWPWLGHYYSMLRRTGRGGPLLLQFLSGDTANENGYAVYNATTCTDQKWPSFATQRSASWAIYRYYPYMVWNNTWYNGPCLYWQAPAGSRTKVSGNDTDGKILLVNETGDAATPYAGALAVRAMFRDARLVAGAGGVTHASSLSGVSCVDNVVARALRDYWVPARKSGNQADIVCSHVPIPPFSASRSSRSTGGDSALATELRQRLLAAAMPRA